MHCILLVCDKPIENISYKYLCDWSIRRSSGYYLISEKKAHEGLGSFKDTQGRKEIDSQTEIEIDFLVTMWMKAHCSY